MTGCDLRRHHRLGRSQAEVVWWRRRMIVIALSAAAGRPAAPVARGALVAARLMAAGWEGAARRLIARLLGVGRWR